MPAPTFFDKLSANYIGEFMSKFYYGSKNVALGRRILCAMFLVFAASNSVFAENQAQKSNDAKNAEGALIQSKDVPLPLLMHSFNSTLNDLKPYVLSFEEFSKKENKNYVSELLARMAKQVAESENKTLKNATGFNYTYNLLSQHLRQTKYLFEKDIAAKAHRNLKTTLGFCIACHERLPKAAVYKPDPELFTKNEGRNLNHADFYYISHQFERALSIYDRFIREFKKTENVDALNNALLRKLSFFVRIAQDPEFAIQSFSKDLENKDMPKDTADVLKNWNRELEEWAKSLKDDKQVSESTADLLKRAREIIEVNVGGRKLVITDPGLIKLLRISGDLYRQSFDESASDEEKAQLLLLLSKCERDLVSVRNYSLADVYLYECVMVYPKTAAAKKCFAEYEVSMKNKQQFGNSEYLDSSIQILKRALKK